MNEITKQAEIREKLCKEIKSMMVEQLDIDMNPEFITNDQPIFGRGLELDSIDALELAVGIYDRFEVSITDDNTSVFSSVNAMVDYIQEQILENDV